MSGTSLHHSENMIPLVNAPKKRRLSFSEKCEFDWEREVRHLMSDFLIPIDIRNSICRNVEREAKVSDSATVLYERARRKAMNFLFN